MRKDLTTLMTIDYQFDPFKYSVPQALRQKTIDVDELIERQVWFSGNSNIIYDYYQHLVKYNSNEPNTKSSYFWVSAPPKLRHVHSGIPSLISETMGNILFKQGMKITCDTSASSDSKDKKNKEAAEIVNWIIDEAKLIDLFMSAAITNSWSGHVDFKFNFDLNLDYKPIVQVLDRCYFSLVQSRGITLKHVFSQWYIGRGKNEGKKYIHEEVYSKDAETGNGTIENFLYLLNTDGSRTPQKLSEIPETANLEPLFVFNDLEGFAAFDIPNLPSASIYLNYPYGQSDYKGAIDIFDALDETATQIVSEIRDKKPIREWDERALQQDGEGNRQIAQYVTNYLAIKTPNGEDAKIVNSYQFTDETVNHAVKFDKLLTLACAKAKISPISLGIPGLNSIDSSDKSTREKSKVTTDTRNIKIGIWKPFVEKFLMYYLKFSKWMINLETYPTNSKASVWRNKINALDLDNLTISVAFPDYLVDAKDTRIATASNAVNGGIMSLETAIDDIHGDDWTEQQKQDEVNRILYRQGMQSDTPDLLSLNFNNSSKQITGTEIVDRVENQTLDPNANKV